jgi:hypothetical protein
MNGGRLVVDRPSIGHSSASPDLFKGAAI